MKLTKVRRGEVKKLFGGCCAYCGVILSSRWHVDHVEPIYRGYSEEKLIPHRGRDVVENLYPACISCNLSKSTMSLDVWRKHLLNRVNVLVEYEKNFRLALAFNQIEMTQSPVVFYFEKFTKQGES